MGLVKKNSACADSVLAIEMPALPVDYDVVFGLEAHRGLPG